MAVLASKVPYSTLGMGVKQPPVISQYTASYRKPVGSGDVHGGGGAFLSPTESEFSVNDGGEESIKSWDENRVGEWLRGINCGQYEHMFKGRSLLMT